jgi:hypothetical protein
MEQNEKDKQELEALKKMLGGGPVDGSAIGTTREDGTTVFAINMAAPWGDIQANLDKIPEEDLMGVLLELKRIHNTVDRMGNHVMERMKAALLGALGKGLGAGITPNPDPSPLLVTGKEIQA